MTLPLYPNAAPSEQATHWQPGGSASGGMVRGTAVIGAAVSVVSAISGDPDDPSDLDELD